MYYEEVPGIRVCAYDASDTLCCDTADEVGTAADLVEQCHLLDLYDYGLKPALRVVCVGLDSE